MGNKESVAGAQDLKEHVEHKKKSKGGDPPIPEKSKKPAPRESFIRIDLPSNVY